MIYKVLIVLLFLLSPNIFTKPAITYNAGGQLRDQLLTYIRAKWISYKYDIDLLYKPFPYSSNLLLHQKEKIYAGSEHFQSIVTLRDERDLNIDPNSSVLYVNDRSLKIIDWNVDDAIIKDENFKGILCDLIKPIVPLKPLNLPKGLTSIAVHVRKGTPYDAPLVSRMRRPGADQSWPLKFPPDEFYIEQIKRFDNILGNKPLLFVIFSDKNSMHIADKYSKIINRPHITFIHSERTKSETDEIRANMQTRNTLDDFFSMQKCDYLIRPDSSFSQSIQILGTFKGVIYPTKHLWKGNKLIITETCLIIDDEKNLESKK